MIQELIQNCVPMLYEDEHYLAVAKPAGMRTTTHERRGLGVLRWLGKFGTTDTARNAELKPTHRLTPAESGVLVLAKSTRAADALNEFFTRGRVQQKFIAVTRQQPKKVLGKPPRPSRDGGRKRVPNSSEVALEVIRTGVGGALLQIRTTGGRKQEVSRLLRTSHLPLIGDTQKLDGTVQPSTRRCFLHLGELSFAHPLTRGRVRITCPTPLVFADIVAGKDGLEDALEVALNARWGCLIDEESDVCRLTCGASEGVPGLTVDRYGSIGVMWTVPHRFDAGAKRLQRAGAFYRRMLNLETIYHKVSVKDRGRPTGDGGVKVDRPLIGQAGETELAVTENGIRFLIRPDDGLMTGLFLDQGNNRRRIRELAAGRRVLNTFAYTCSFSVAAAIGGATETVSVDLSKRALEWGKRNFVLNELPLDNHKFICSEIFDYFKRARRQGQRFGLIILDPPTFARSKKPKRVFTIAGDLEPLIADALQVLDPDGVLLISTNARSASVGFLRAALERSAATRPFRILAVPRPPLDCATDRERSKSVLVQFG